MVLHHHLLDVSRPALRLVLLHADLPLSRRRVALALTVAVSSGAGLVVRVGHDVEDDAVVATGPVDRWDEGILCYVNRDQLNGFFYYRLRDSPVGMGASHAT